MEQAKTAQTITLSFDDDCIIIDNVPKTTNNLVTIDLTKKPDSNSNLIKSSTGAIPKSRKNDRKTIELRMEIGECMTLNKPKEKPLIDRNIEEQSGCSKDLIKKPINKKPLDLLENHEEVICSSCTNIIPPKKGVILMDCSHYFCRQCLIHSIYKNCHTIDGVIKCPLGAENCDKNLKESEIKILLGSEYAVFKEQMKYNMENFQEHERRRKEHEKQMLLPSLLSMDDIIIIPNLEPFECQICFAEIDFGKGVILQNCLHQFCQECLVGCIEAAEEFEVKCPFIDGETQCKEILKEREVKAIISADTYEKHLAKSLKFAENANELIFHCRTPDCPYFVEVDDQIVNFKCSICKRINCIACKAIHEGKSCLDYQEEANPDLKTARMNNENVKSEEAILKMIEDNLAMYCPRCTVPVEKIAGCDFIVCSSCKLGLCWATKKPRNDLLKANGIVIKGCGCMPTKKCHPNCGNCH